MSIPESTSPISSSGVEVISRDSGLHVDYNGNNLPEAYGGVEKEKVESSPEQVQQRRIILRLIVGLALGWILAVVATATAGALAAKRLHALQQMSSATFEPKQGITGSSGQDVVSTTSTLSTTTTYTTAIASSSTNSPSVPSNSVAILNSTCPPSTDCSALSSPYTAINDVLFNVQCQTDYNLPHSWLLFIYVYQFEDCINACATYNKGHISENSTCYSASYSIGILRADIRNNGEGNCVLRGEAGGEAMRSANRSSAVLLRT